MAEEYTDPSGNTEQFRAFVHDTEAPTPAKRSPLPLVVAVVAGVIVVAAAVWFIAGR
jgi:hypothetical protein